MRRPHVYERSASRGQRPTFQEPSPEATWQVADAYRAQGDALLIESQTKIRLADEYGAAQERGEVGQQTGRPKVVPVENDFTPATADLGLTRKDIHEARRIRDAEATNPGIVRRVVDECILCLGG